VYCKILDFVYYNHQLFTSAQPQEEKVAQSPEPKLTDNVESAIEQAKRAFALRQFEQAVEHYATALELV
jgi:HAT1-interacting factor 1